MAVLWNALRHENVLPLLGVTMSENQVAMVSEWMVGDDIVGFVKVNPDVDRLGLVCFPFKAELYPSLMMTRLL